MADAFWTAIAAQIKELETAKNADDVVRILSHERNPDEHASPDSAADGFFAGSGGDATVNESLVEAGWRILWSRAGYFWAMQAPDGGSAITYVEGDIYRGNRRPV